MLAVALCIENVRGVTKKVQSDLRVKNCGFQDLDFLKRDFPVF